jgi:hypothetical protein
VRWWRPVQDTWWRGVRAHWINSYTHWILFFGAVSSYMIVATQGSHLGSPRLAAVTARLCVMARPLLQSLVMVARSSKGQFIVRLGKTGATRGVDGQHWVYGLGRLHNRCGNKGGESYILICYGKIRVCTTTIYRASCSRLSRTDGTLSSRRIWFKISSILFVFVGEKIFGSQHSWSSVEDDSGSDCTRLRVHCGMWAMKQADYATREEKEKSGPCRIFARDWSWI